MLWNWPPGWQAVLRAAVAELRMPAGAVLTIGRHDVGRVWDVTVAA